MGSLTIDPPKDELQSGDSFRTAYVIYCFFYFLTSDILLFIKSVWFKYNSACKSFCLLIPFYRSFRGCY